MFNPEKRLIVDIKVQNRLREWFANLPNGSKNINLYCIEFGDSDIDYNLGYDYTKIRILNAPYNIEKIKNKLAFEGQLNGLTGTINSYIRFVNDNGIVESFYQYPTTDTLTPGITPPTLQQANNINEIILKNNLKYGWIVFNETLPENYVDDLGNQLRLKEEFDITLTNPNNLDIQIIKDIPNGSLFLFVNNINETSGSIIGDIKIRGLASGLIKIINLKIE